MRQTWPRRLDRRHSRRVCERSGREHFLNCLIAPQIYVAPPVQLLRLINEASERDRAAVAGASGAVAPARLQLFRGNGLSLVVALALPADSALPDILAHLVGEGMRKGLRRARVARS